MKAITFCLLLLSGYHLQAALPDMQTMLQSFHSLGEGRQIIEERANLSRAIDEAAAFMVQDPRILDNELYFFPNTKISIFKNSNSHILRRAGMRKDFFKFLIPVDITVEAYQDMPKAFKNIITALSTSSEVSMLSICSKNQPDYLLLSEGGCTEYMIAKVLDVQGNMLYSCTLGLEHPEGMHE